MTDKRKVQDKKAQQDEQAQQDKKSKDTSVVVALIGAGATIIAAFIGILSIWSKPNSVVAIATSTSTPSISYLDDFSSGAAKWWGTDFFENEYWSSSPSINNGAYRWQVTSKQPVFVSLDSKIPPLANFELELTITRIDNSENSSYGVSFHTSNNSGYDLKFEPSKPGKYKLQRRDGNNNTTLIDWTELSAINKNGDNKIHIIVVGSAIKIFINEGFAGEVDDNVYQSGKIGLFAGMLEGETIIVDISDFKVTIPASP